MGNVQGSAKRPNASLSLRKSHSRDRLYHQNLHSNHHHNHSQDHNHNSTHFPSTSSNENNSRLSTIGSTSQERIQLMSIQANLQHLPADWLLQIEDCVRIWEERLCIQLAGKQLSSLPPWLQLGTQVELVAEMDLSGNRLRTFPPELARFRRLERLALGNNELVAIPDEIGALKSLQWLDFTHNRISQVSERIGELPNLVSLGASDCRLGRFPVAFCRLARLRKLGCFNNLFSELPPEIGQLKHLTKLDLSGNSLTKLPPEIGNLTALTWLNVSNNRLEELPVELGACRAIRELGMANNRLCYLPDLSNLHDLILLTVFNNQLKEIGPWICKLESLQKLDISTNQLVHLPSGILRLPHLHLLNVRGNQLLYLPAPHPHNHLLRPSTVNILDIRDNQLVSLPAGTLGPRNIMGAGNPWLGEPLPSAVVGAVASLRDLSTSTLLMASALPGARMALLKLLSPLLRHQYSKHFDCLDASPNTPNHHHYKHTLNVCQACKRPFVHLPIRYLDSVMSSDEQMIPTVIILCSSLCRHHYESHRSITRVKIYCLPSQQQ